LFEKSPRDEFIYPSEYLQIKKEQYQYIVEEYSVVELNIKLKTFIDLINLYAKTNIQVI